MNAAAKSAANQVRQELEALKKQVLQGRDIKTAKAIAKRIETLGEIQSSIFIGTWNSSWGHPNQIIIKNDDVVIGWGDRRWRQVGKANQIEFYKRGNRWTSSCVISDDGDTLHLPDGSGKLWRQK